MNGQVVHFEIPADDLARAKQFYLSTFNWGLEDVPGAEYTMARTVEVGDDHMPKTKGAINGGLTMRSDTFKSPVITINVDSIEDALAKITANGGSLVAPKTEVMGMGYTAYAKDTEGNTIGLWEVIKH